MVKKISYFYLLLFLLFFVPLFPLPLFCFSATVTAVILSEKRYLKIFFQWKLWIPVLIIIFFNLITALSIKNPEFKASISGLIFNEFNLNLILRLFGLIMILKLLANSIDSRLLYAKIRSSEDNLTARGIVLSLNLLNILKGIFSETMYLFKLRRGLKINLFKNLYILLLSILALSFKISEELALLAYLKFSSKKK